MAGPKARIEYVPLSEIKGALRNPKDHDVGEMHLSVERHGLADPPALNEKTGRLVEGHGRLDVLRQMKVAGEPEPRYVQKRADGEWTIPVVRGLSWETDEEAEAYLVAHNRIGEKGGWDESVLTGVLSDLAAADALDGVGYDAEDIDELLAQQEPEIVGHADPDEVPEPPDQPMTKRGDVWLCGRHRVMCGDATSVDDADTLLRGARPHMAYVDPPYGINAVTGQKGQWGGVAERYEPVLNDHDTQTALDVYGLVSGMGVPVQVFWGANHYASGLPDSPGWIVWYKRMGADANDFADCELAWTNRACRTRLFQHVWNGFLRDSERGEARVRPTQKPVALAEWCFEEYGEAGESVLDPCGGSGATLIAAEKTNRACYVMELSERYCDVICRRYQQFAGTLPVLESTGEAHDFAADKAAA